MKQEDRARFEECIRDAIEATEEAQAMLDLRSKKCPTCGANRFKTYTDKLTSNILGAVLTRLEGEHSKSQTPGGVDAPW